AEAGFRNDASAMLEQAAKGIDGKKMPGSLALGYISRAFGEIGRPATALATAAASPERRVQFDGLLNAAASYAKLGSTDSAVALLNKAAEVAASESEWHSRAPGWVAVAKQLAGIKEWKPAMEVLKKLQEGSNTLAPAAQFDAAVGIAECLVALRLSSQADSASAQVIRFSQGMSDPNVLGVVAATITAAAEAYIDSGMTASGIRLLDHAATVAGSSLPGPSGNRCLRRSATTKHAPEISRGRLPPTNSWPNLASVRWRWHQSGPSTQKLGGSHRPRN
ncbi:MAG: hypothetical protein UZ07_CHB004001201, partial [Chlorobi bacterium OLB7]